MSMAVYPFSIKLKSPLVHGDFDDGLDTGNFRGFRRLSCIGIDNEIYRIPVISGNAIRGLMRRLLTLEYLKATGIQNDKLYIAMANGGAIGKTLDAYIRPELIQSVKNLFPIISALGSALYSFMLPGVVNISFAILQCTELATGDKPCADMLTDISQTRHIERTRANYILEDLEVKPMPYTVEALIPGAKLDCKVSFLDMASDMDISVVCHGLNLLSGLGGKNAVGFGEIELSQSFDDSLYCEWLQSLPDDYNERALKVIGSL